MPDDGKMVQLDGVRVSQNSFTADKLRDFAGPRGIRLMWIVVNRKDGDNGPMCSCHVAELDYVRYGRTMEDIATPFKMSKETVTAKSRTLKATWTIDASEIWVHEK